MSAKSVRIDIYDVPPYNKKDKVLYATEIPEKDSRGNIYRGLRCSCGRIHWRHQSFENFQCSQCHRAYKWGRVAGDETFPAQ